MYQNATANGYNTNGYLNANAPPSGYSAASPPEDSQEDSHLRRFWKLLTFKRLPDCAEDINALVQVEMMKHISRAPICKIGTKQIERYLTRLFVKETAYFCYQSKMMVQSPEIRKIIDMILAQGLQWHIETNVDNVIFLYASWHHWTI